MTDSKTAKKIDDLQDCVGCKEGCPLVPSSISGEFVHMSSVGRIVCRGLAGAIAKKRVELEAISEPLRTNFGADAKVAAAVQPTETRPPQKVYTMFRNKRFGTWSIAFNGQALISGLSKEDAENTLKRYNEAARAASPVARPQQPVDLYCAECDHKESAHLNGGKCEAWYAARFQKPCECQKFIPPATELVEPAPRPQSYCGTTFRHLAHDDCDGKPSAPRVGEIHAASSPVARPRVKAHCMVCRQFKEVPSEVVNVCDDCAKKLNSTIVQSAEPAARVEQPTPSNFLSDFQMPSCSQCGAPYKVYCAECGNFKPAPAAPVVEQRDEKLQIVLDAAQEVVSTFGTNENYYKVRALQFALNAYEQRTEGEGQPK